MPDVETSDGDAAEQEQAVTISSTPERAGSSWDANEADVAEQGQPVVASAAAAEPGARWDADEGDVAESALDVPLDEDEYR